MSFGFSPSDIVVSYQLAREIYYRCFTKSQAAGASKLPSPWRDDSACCFPFDLNPSLLFSLEAPH